MLNVFASIMALSPALSMSAGGRTGEAGAQGETLYYHGTQDMWAYPIMRDGFRLYKENEMHGKVLGYGIYLARELKSAAYWAEHALIKCRLNPCKILWIEPSYKPKIIDHLRREFGRELLTQGPKFKMSIPRNKRLTPEEIKFAERSDG